MEQLTNIIEAILFASGNGVLLADIADKLNVTMGEVKKSLAKLKEKYGEEGGIQLLEFNKKAQLGSNPAYKTSVEAVLNPIREKELTRTILECAAIIAYKQPITRTEIELLRGLNSDYAVNALLDLKLIEPCGRKDAVGRPVLFGTTDQFLKRFKLNSLADLPDYDELMAAIRPESDRDSYLYAREDGIDDRESSEEAVHDFPAETQEKENPRKKKTESESETKDAEGKTLEGGYEIPDFLRGLDDADIVKIS